MSPSFVHKIMSMQILGTRTQVKGANGRRSRGEFRRMELPLLNRGHEEPSLRFDRASDGQMYLFFQGDRDKAASWTCPG
jgi:hypothetical protein